MSASNAIQHAIVFIKKEWKQGKSLKEVASKFHVDSGNLARAFKQAEGMTAKQFVDRKRMEFVKQAIATDHQYGYEIGAALGFSSDYSFYRWVKRVFQISFAKIPQALDKKG